VTTPQIENDYVKTGKVRYVFGDFPLEAIHGYAFKAAVAANCAGEQGKYWEMHDRLFANQSALKPEDLVTHAEAIGLDKASFQQCLQSGKYDAAIRKMISQGEKAGVRATPTLMVGIADPNSTTVRVTRVVVGLQPPSVLKEAINSALAATQK
jgi:protein-disulfide isomerase